MVSFWNSAIYNTITLHVFLFQHHCVIRNVFTQSPTFYSSATGILFYTLTSSSHLDLSTPRVRTTLVFSYAPNRTHCIQLLSRFLTYFQSLNFAFSQRSQDAAFPPPSQPTSHSPTSSHTEYSFCSIFFLLSKEQLDLGIVLKTWPTHRTLAVDGLSASPTDPFNRLNSKTYLDFLTSQQIYLTSSLPLPSGTALHHHIYYTPKSLVVDENYILWTNLRLAVFDIGLL